MRVRAGVGTPEDLIALIDEAGLTLAARKKTMTLLRRIWLVPRDELIPFCDQGLEVWREGAGTPPAALAWGMTIVAYPFFARVVELVGRLTSLQGDCRASEVHRRMEEMFGQREGTRRMTNMALQTQADWGVIDRGERGQLIVRKEAIRLVDDRLVAWLIEAGLRHAGRSVPAASAGSLPVMYPFTFERPLAMVIANAPGLELRYHGPGEQVLDIRERA